MTGSKSSKSAFLKIARELGCDADDPRVAAILKGMGEQGPKPHKAVKGQSERKTPQKPSGK